MKFNKLIFFLILPVLIASCASSQPAAEEAQDRMRIFTSIVPQQYFVERIGGDLVTTAAMVEPGASPATYEPKPSQMAALGDTQIYFSIGVPFENAWLEKIADVNPAMKIVDTTQGIEMHVMDVDHSHEGEEHIEEEGALDPHIWLSPALVKIQAENIHAALISAAPEHEQVFTQNLNEFVAEVEALQEEMRNSLSGLSSTKFMVFHPSWGYFAEEFGLEMIAIEVGGTEPSAAELAALIDTAKEQNIHVIFAQPEFSTQDASTIAEAIDGEVILISPLAYDWFENMRQVTAIFTDVLK